MLADQAPAHREAETGTVADLLRRPDTGRERPDPFNRGPVPDRFGGRGAPLPDRGPEREPIGFGGTHAGTDTRADAGTHAGTHARADAGTDPRADA